MPSGQVTVLGGLPAIAEVSFYSGDGWSTDDDADVDALFWVKRDGSKGAPFSEKMYDRLEKRDPYWVSHVVEQICDQLAHEDYLERLEQGKEESVLLL
jgi:hypothetical protein